MKASDYVRPSIASQLMRCSGYAQLNATLGAPFAEEEDTEVREDGTACHWLAERTIRGHAIEINAISPNARVITAEMKGAVGDYIAAMSAIAPIKLWHIEEKVPVSTVISGMQDGTPDAWFFDLAASTLYVFDLKFGFRYVDAYENVQLSIYALTIILAVLGVNIQCIKVKLAIFQPRAPSHEGSLRWWSPTADKLMWFHAAITSAVWRALQPDAPCTPNPGCGECPAAHGCHALRIAASHATHVAYAPVPAVLDNERLGYELAIRHAARKTLDAQIAALETQTEHALRHGQRVVGYELAPRRTLWRWRNETEERLLRLAPLFGIEVAETKVKSVAQLRALLPKEIVDLYAEKPNGGMVLKATDPKEAERRFNQE